MAKNKTNSRTSDNSNKMTRSEAGRMGGEATHTCRGRECSSKNRSSSSSRSSSSRSKSKSDNSSWF